MRWSRAGNIYELYPNNAEGGRERGGYLPYCDGDDLDDVDDDGWSSEAVGGADCDDDSPTVSPGANEECDPDSADDLDCDGDSGRLTMTAARSPARAGTTS